ncbi:T9SS type A sorting domain-containing protein [Flavivirga algicola]|uniref:T9SS type A sorting domain-containing protein n=1 Tax=Flavivirga algicola TaxID=2729136 RepID=A0ABX1S0W5_9FLAO|nr:T9SS type A sorting domain-containing protein [Flavivirga algicola]NMH89519.1 T9SS type A sorting domain-containing protein [Flavivirga algicola]
MKTKLLIKKHLIILSFFIVMQMHGQVTVVSTIDASILPDKEVNFKTEIKIYPNPTNNYISLSGLSAAKNYTIYNVLGKKVAKGIIANNSKTNVKFLNKGLYLLKIENHGIVKFIRE